MDSQLIATEPLEREGEKKEKRVWHSVQQTFVLRNCPGYWRYPMFSQVGKYRHEPDILIADR